MVQPIVRRALFAAAAVLLLGACREDGEDARAPAVRMDTANASWEDGLSAEQVESEARGLSPEEAAAQGLAVDTTIHLEVPLAGDTVFVPRGNDPTPPPVDTADRDSAPPR